MSLTYKNILANFGGSAWTSLIGIVFVPLYIKYLGVEAYGLVGLYATLQSIFVVIDMGLSTTMSREIARLSLDINEADSMLRVSKTLEITYWVAALLFGLIIVVVSPYIANKWLNIEQLSQTEVEVAIMAIGLAVAFQMPSSLYIGGLAGFQKQILTNKIIIITTTIRNLGALSVLIFFSNGIIFFFSWQIIASALSTFFLAYYFKYILFKHNIKDFSFSFGKYKKTLKEIGSFSTGVITTTLMAIIFMQIDKIVLSKMLSLKMFGYYMIAYFLCSSIYRVVQPITNVALPKFTEIFTNQKNNELAETYHHFCKLISLVVMPLASVGIFFSYEILLLWTQSISIAENTYIVLAILFFATMLNSLYHVPYQLQLAMKWTKIGLYSTTISVILMVPMVIVSTQKYGIIGAASSWLVLNLWYIFLVIPIMHSKILQKEKINWYVKDIFIPFIIAFFIAAGWRLISNSSIFENMQLLPIIFALLFSYIILGYFIFREKLCAIFVRGNTNAKS